METIKELKAIYAKHEKICLTVLTPVAVSIIPILSRTKESYFLFILLIMSVYWMTVCMPIAVTGLLPIIMFPMFGLAPSRNVSDGYFQDIVVMYYGGLVMANAFQIVKIPEFLSVKFLKLFGSDPKWLLLGVMITTAFLSLWITNASACALLLPIIYEIIRQILIHHLTVHSPKKLEKLDISTIENEIRKETIEKNVFSDDELFITENSKKLGSGFFLACTFASTIGSFSSLVKTAPNILLKGFFEQKYPNSGLNFLTFSIFTLPISIAVLFITWLWLSISWIPREYSCGCARKAKGEDKMGQFFREKSKSLGPMTWSQKCVLLIFLILIILWIIVDSEMVSSVGYGSLLNDATPAVFIVLLLFMCPKENIFKGKPYSHLIDWRELQEIFPWDIVLIIGGGLSIGDGFQVSGLSNFLGENFKSLIINIVFNKKEIALIVIVVLCSFTTQLTVNVYISSIFLPIVDSIANELNINTTYLLVPLIISSNFGYMLPLSTLNNALVLGNKFLSIGDMCISGLYVNTISVVVLLIASNTYFGFIFDLSTLPKVNTSLVDNYNFTNTNNTLV